MKRGAKAQKAFADFEQSLADHGFQGDAMDESSVSKFFSGLNQNFDSSRYRSLIAAVKAFSVSEEEGGTRLVIDWVEEDELGEAMANEVTAEDEEELPKEKSASISAMKNSIRELRMQVKALSSSGGDKAPKAVPSNYDFDRLESSGRNVFKSADRSHKMGLWAMANCNMYKQFRPEPAEKAPSDLASMGHKAMASSPVADGGALIPDEFSAELIDNQKEYGVIPKTMRSWTMNSGTLRVPKNNGGMTVSYPEEGGAASDTSPSLSEVLLKARMGVAIGIVSRQLFDDSAINIGEFLARETSRAFALAKDEAGFNGTGLAATGGMSGLAATFAAKASDARTVTGGGTMLLHTKPKITEMVSKLGSEYLPGAAFHCSTAAKANIFHRLQGEVGGLGMAEVAGKFYDTFMGYPIITNEVMNASEDFGGDVVDCYFGNFALAGAYGDRMELAIDTNPNEYWTTNQIGIRGVARYDVNWHSLGSSTASEGIVALWQD